MLTIMRFFTYWDAEPSLKLEGKASIQHVEHMDERVGSTERTEKVGHSENIPKDESKAYPAFSDLPIRDGDPKYSAWTLWGRDDEIGTLHHLTPEAVANAAREVKRGLRFSLNWPLNTPATPGFGRSMYPFTHNLHCDASGLLTFDDSLAFNTQISSQWDGLRHFAYQKERLFYNGRTKLAIEATGSGTLGLQNISSQGDIAGRGVLIDYCEYAASIGKEYNATGHHAIGFDDLMACIAYQERLSGVSMRFSHGDILIVRCGYTKKYLSLTPSEEVAAGMQTIPQTCGLEQDVRTLQWLWDNRFSAVAGDSPSFEAFPPAPGADFLFHEVLLAGWGCPIGEMFMLEDLAESCRQNRRWSFFVASCPLNVFGGVASPANIMAIA